MTHHHHHLINIITIITIIIIIIINLLLLTYPPATQARVMWLIIHYTIFKRKVIFFRGSDNYISENKLISSLKNRQFFLIKQAGP